MFMWAEQLQSPDKVNGPKPSRSQLSLVVALFDESENMYMSSGRSMRHVLLDSDTLRATSRVLFGKLDAICVRAMSSLSHSVV